MKKRFLLLIIYLAFISLGLPDSLLGAAWPTMYLRLNVPVHYAGIISMIVAAGTVVSSLWSARVIDRFGVAAVTTGSVLMTALALVGFSYSQHFMFLCLLAVPLGLGAGCVDAALNNYVALHYKARHMNWLHCFWGIGAALGPVIMARYLAAGQPWTAGYHTVGLIQLSLAAALLLSIPLWVRGAQAHHGNEGPPVKSSFKALLAIPGIRQALAVFFCYCTIEATFGLWGASYLVFERGFKPENAARFVSLYYIGITAGRFIAGIASEKLSNRQLVYLGEGLIIVGLLVVLLPSSATLLPGFFLVGLGCAPIFPALLHETPQHFGKQHAQAVMGIQMASAYIGITTMPLLFGKLASYTGYASLLWFTGIVLTVMIYMTFRLNRKAAATASL